LFLVAYILLLFRAFVYTTAFDSVFPVLIARMIRYLAYGILLVRIIMERKIKGRLFLVGIVMLGVSFFARIQSSYGVLIDYAFCCVFSIGVEFRKIVKAYVITSTFLIVITIAASIFGIIPNYTYYRGGVLRLSMGFVYPTDFVAHIYFLVCGILYLLNDRLKRWQGVLIIFSAYIIFRLTSARGPSAMIVFAFLTLYFNQLRMRKKKRLLFSKWLLEYSPALCALITFAVIFAFDPDIPFWRELDRFTSSRLSLATKQLSENEITLFGQYIQQKGNGHGVYATSTKLGYTFIDLSFLRILLLYGIVFLIFIVIYSILNNKKALRDCDYNLPLLMLLTSFYSLTAQHYFDFAYNFLLLGYFATLYGDKTAMIAVDNRLFGRKIVFSAQGTKRNCT